MQFRTYAVAAATLIAGLTAGGPTRAQDAATLDEVRCLVLAANMLGSGDEALALPGMMAFLYFMGRVEGRLTDSQLEASIRQEATRMSDEQLKATGLRCGGIMEERGKAIEAIGRNLTEGVLEQ